MKALSITRLAVIMRLMLLPTVAWAQTATTASIAGAVKDTTGAVLPGVTVEAASPALIEKVRTVVTDSEGQYKIVDLRPGVYTVTFTLTSFSAIKREGIELTTGFTAAVNAELKVGSIEETITVSGASPVVDTQNTNQQKVMSRAVLESIPTNNAVQGFAAVIPGAVLSGGQRGVDVGGSSSDSNITMAVHGGRGTDLKVTMDGMGVATMMGAGGGTSRHYSFNAASAEEIVLQTAGMSSESETGGIQINMVPKDGGNLFKGIFEANYANDRMQTKNLTDELIARGLRATPSVKKIYAARGGLGGPIKKDTLWFYTSHGYWRSTQEVAGNYFNKVPGTLLYQPDLSQPALADYPYNEHGLRLTWQAAPKHKITALYSDESGVCICYWSVDQGAFRPEATIHLLYSPIRVAQVSWSSPVSNRLLLEAGATRVIDYGQDRHTTLSAETDRAITDLSDGYQYGSRWPGAAPGLTDYTFPPYNDTSSFNTRFAASYVTGSHAVKIGGTTITGLQTLNVGPNYPEAYTFRNQVPVSLSQIVTPLHAEARVKLNLGLYAQDQWTMRRLTLNLGVRFSHLNTYLPAMVFPAGEYLPETKFARVDDVVNWKDVTPRLGASYDLFGNGKTALKVSLGRYVNAESLGITLNASAVSRLVPTASRTWNDSLFPVGDPRRGNYVPDCDLHSVVANGECGALSNANFGKVVVDTRWADDVVHGWGVRPYNWQSSASVQQELRPGVALNVGYFRTSFGNFTVTDNLTLAPADYDPYCITAPVDARIPGGGGNPVCGLYDLKPTSFGRPANNLVAPASNFGKETDSSHTIDVTINARFGRGGLLTGGLSTTRTVADACDIATNHPEVVATLLLPNGPYPSGAFTTGPSSPTQFCRVMSPFASMTQVKLSGTYPLPWWGLQVAATLQSVPGPSILANYVATNAQIVPSLGRNLGQCGTSATCNGTVTISNLIDPNSQLEARRNQIDVRLTKFVRMGRVRLRGNLDVYNLFNGSGIINATTRYSPTNSWLQPSTVEPARLFKVGGQLDF